MVAMAVCGSVASGSTEIDSTRMRGSQSSSAFSIRPWINCRVVTVFGSKRNRPNPPPKSANCTRSPCSVIRMTRIASRTLVSPSEKTIRPSGPIRGGKLIPLPKMRPASVIGSPLRLETWKLETEPEKWNPVKDDVEQRDDDHQQQQCADGDDRNRQRTHLPFGARTFVRRAQTLVKRPGQYRKHQVAERHSLNSIDLPAQHIRDHEGGILVELAQSGGRGVDRQGDAYRARRRIRVEKPGHLKRLCRLTQQRRIKRAASRALEDAADHEPSLAHVDRRL